MDEEVYGRHPERLAAYVLFFSFTSLVTAICQCILVTNVLLMIWFISMNEEALKRF